MTRDQFQKYGETILSCPLFCGMNGEDVAELPIIASGELITSEDGETLDSSFLYIVLEGNIHVKKSASDGRYVSMLYAKPGAPVNAASVLNRRKDLSLLEASGRCVCLRASEKAIRDSLEGGGLFSIRYTEFLTDRICFLNYKIASFSGHTAESRLTLYLQSNAVNGAVTLPSSLSSFADTLGVGRASLYRALDSLEGMGCISRKGRTITITGPLS